MMKNVQNSKNDHVEASPWLLCPSKSLPGKFYYFNGTTGETAWCQSDTHKFPKKVPTAKTNNYPEPPDRPIDNSTNTTTPSSFRNAGIAFSHTANVRPVFGQAVFPKYVPPDFTTKFVWALTPVYVPNQMPPHRQMLNHRIETYEREQAMFVPSLDGRFQASTRPAFPPEFQLQPFKEIPIFDQPSNLESMVPKPKLKDEACQTFVPTAHLGTQSERDTTPKSAPKQSRSVDLPLSKHMIPSTLCPPSKVENGNDKLSKLDKNDLRFKLMAKKKEVEMVIGVKAVTSTVQSKATKIREGIPPEGKLPEKRVTFNLQEPEASHTSSEDVQEIGQSPNPHIDGTLWHVAADTEALLSGLQSIEEFVKSDVNCRLLVPHAVYSELESLARGDSGEVSARQVLRKLHTHENHIIVQSKPEHELSTEDSILHCCGSLLQEDCHVILITNGKNIKQKAKTINLDCYTLHDITIEVSSDNGFNLVPKKDLENDTKKSENLFMQTLEEINGFSVTKPNGLNILPSRNGLFTAETDNVFNNMESDKLINLTRPKEKVKTVFCSEISNVKNQTVKDSITENSPVQNRTKQNMENMFRNTGLRQIGQNPAFDLRKPCEQNASSKINTDNNINIDASDLDIRRLNMIENHQEKSRDNKFNNQFNLEEELERFCIKNSEMETRVKNRLDEWVCRLSQCMEEALTDLIFKKKPRSIKMVPPKNPLFELIQGTGEIFKKHTNIKLIIEQFPIQLISCMFNNGKFKKNFTPNEFMELLGSSVILIKQLKEIVKCEELYKGEEMLEHLIKNIEDPTTDIELSLEKTSKPMLSAIEDPKTPIPFRKSRTEVLEYLKKHFAAWQNKTDTVDGFDNGPNILVTSGKNLNTVKINNTKAITVGKNTNSALNTQTNNENKEKVNAHNQPKVIRNVKIINAFEEKLEKRSLITVEKNTNSAINTPTNNENNEKVNAHNQPKVIRNVKIMNAFEEKLEKRSLITVEKNTNSAINTPTNNENNEKVNDHNQPKVIRNVKIMNAFEERLKKRILITVQKNTNSALNTQTNNENNEKVNAHNQPKVIRNVKIMNDFEERLKKRALMELDELDYEENEFMYTAPVTTDINSGKPDGNDVIDDLFVSGSDTDSECTRAYQLRKIFLVTVKSTIKQTFNFVKRSTQEYREGSMSLDRKAEIKWKTKFALNSLPKIAERLKKIIARESGDADGITLKDLIKPGGYGNDDDRVANYKQTVTEFLEKVHALEEILQYLLSISNVSKAGSSKDSDRTYCTYSVPGSLIPPTRIQRKGTTDQ